MSSRIPGGVRVRPGRYDDARAVASIHTRAFPGFFLTELGPRFLNAYYRAVTSAPGGILLVAEDETAIVGFVVGYTSERDFYRTLKRNPWRLFAAIGFHAVRHPSVVRSIWRRYHDAVNHAGEQSCEGAYLASLAVDPAASRSGTGGVLVREFCIASALLGKREVYLTTDTDANEQVNRFYERQGFSATSQFTTSAGRRMNEYRKRCERDEPLQSR